VITSLELQLQVLQLQAPPAHTDPTEPDTVLDVDEGLAAMCGRMRDRLTFCSFDWIG
jgi:hypothetical protein